MKVVWESLPGDCISLDGLVDAGTELGSSFPVACGVGLVAKLAGRCSGLWGCRESGMTVTPYGIDPDRVGAVGLVSLSELSGPTLSLWWVGLGPGQSPAGITSLTAGERGKAAFMGVTPLPARESDSRSLVTLLALEVWMSAAGITSLTAGERGKAAFTDVTPLPAREREESDSRFLATLLALEVWM